MLVDDNELNLMADSHSKADLGEVRVPVGRQLGLLCVKPSLRSCQVVCVAVTPKMGAVVKSSLK